MKISELSPLEVAVVAAMRAGARLSVSFTCKTNADARQHLLPFVEALHTMYKHHKKQRTWAIIGLNRHVDVYGFVKGKRPDHGN